MSSYVGLIAHVCGYLHVTESVRGSAESRVVCEGIGPSVLVCLSIKLKVEVSKYTELLYIRYSIPTAGF